ncbi:MAG: NADH-quinone oxidoreductase subunit C [Kangiellaceae bacterium]|jgi:NADH-quinone oxidoreductase subunit C|nr:NADH-quinone oxidoreductase subunit C [Kangiellaceae bacterium]
MVYEVEELINNANRLLSEQVVGISQRLGEITLEVEPDYLIAVCRQLRDQDVFHFEQLIDLCGVDYLSYGVSEWQTEDATGSGFSRAKTLTEEQRRDWQKSRFAVIYHLLSVTNNQRLRLRCFVPDKSMMVPSLTSVWSSANWYEREAFDLFGIRFEDHDDLRRILTDYGFVGHPFRKDFPLSGHVEMRYDATEKRCVYEPVSIEPRVLVPKVVRHDARYQTEQEDG